MNLDVKFRRVWQTRPYETEEVELRMGGNFFIGDDEGDPTKAPRVAKLAAETAKQLYAALAAIGDQIMTERLQVKDPRGAPSVPGRRY